MIQFEWKQNNSREFFSKNRMKPTGCLYLAMETNSCAIGTVSIKRSNYE